MTLRIVQVGDHQPEVSWQSSERKRHDAAFAARRKVTAALDRIYQLLNKEAPDFAYDLEFAVDQLNFTEVKRLNDQLFDVCMKITLASGVIERAIQEVSK